MPRPDCRLLGRPGVGSVAEDLPQTSMVSFGSVIPILTQALGLRKQGGVRLSFRGFGGLWGKGTGYGEIRCSWDCLEGSAMNFTALVELASIRKVGNFTFDNG
jgi:hypothetical protein